MEEKKIDDINLSLKIFENLTDKVIAKEQKEFLLLSFDDNLSDFDLLYSCYEFVGTDNNNIPNIRNLVADFNFLSTYHVLQRASIYMDTPDGTYPKVQLNKNEINTKETDIALQRIKQHINLLSNEKDPLILRGIAEYLYQNRMSFEINSEFVNIPWTKEVW